METKISRAKINLLRASDNRENGSTHHFDEDTAEAPKIDGRRVSLHAQQDLGGAVPEGHDLVGQVSDGHGEGAGEAEVGQLDPTLGVHEQVLGLEVAVEDAVGVAVGDPGQQLVHVALKRGTWSVSRFTRKD